MSNGQFVSLDEYKAYTTPIKLSRYNNLDIQYGPTQSDMVNYFNRMGLN